MEFHTVFCAWGTCVFYTSSLVFKRTYAISPVLEKVGVPQDVGIIRIHVRTRVELSDLIVTLRITSHSSAIRCIC